MIFLLQILAKALAAVVVNRIKNILSASIVLMLTAITYD